MATTLNLTSPVGRVVLGNLYKANTKDAEGKPLVVKNGPNVGQPRTNFFFAVAIPKGQEQSWAQTPWGQQIYQVAAAAFPQAVQTPAFAWKIEDGDSQVPNKRGRKPADNEGWAGNWILKFSGGYAPKVYRQEGTAWLQEVTPDYVKPGYFVEVNFNVAGNDSQSQPGIYLNHGMVAFRAYGPEINFGPNPEDAGFGAAPLPQGASAAPLASATSMPANPSLPAVPNATGVPAAVAATPIVNAAGVMPNTQFLNGPVTVPAVPVVQPATIPTSPSSIPPAPPAAPQMTAKANGATAEQMRTAGWSDAQMIANGYMTA